VSRREIENPILIEMIKRSLLNLYQIPFLKYLYKLVQKNSCMHKRIQICQG